MNILHMSATLSFRFMFMSWRRDGKLDELVRTLEMLLNQGMPAENVPVITDDSSCTHYEMNNFYAAGFGNQQINFVVSWSLLSW